MWMLLLATLAPLRALELPLARRQGMPYATVGGAEVLVDSGASATYLRGSLLEAYPWRGESSAALCARAAELGAVALERTSLRLPDDSAGIVGWDVLSSYASVEFDLTAGVLRLDGPAGASAGPKAPVTPRALGASSGLYPLVACQFFGAGDCAVEALLDTGSPSTLANEALASAAGLFPDDEVDGDFVTTGAGGESAALRRCRAAGLVLGERIERPGAAVLVGDLPQWAALGVEGPAALVGLDVLGARFRVERDASAAPPRKKSRRRGADSGGGAWTLVVEG